MMPDPLPQMPTPAPDPIDMGPTGPPPAAGGEPPEKRYCPYCGHVLPEDL